jgi:beta-fructofuranosidase
MWAWSRVRHRLKDVPIQSSIQCLPRELSLPADGVLRIKPLTELEQLRYDAATEENVTIPADAGHQLRGITGDTLELKITFQPGSARRYGVQVYCDPQGRNGFPITFDPAAKTLSMGETKIPLALHPGEDLELCVFLDKSIIEVFANGRLAALAPYRYEPGSLGIRLFSEGGSVLARKVAAWKLRSIYAGKNAFSPDETLGPR